MEGNSGEVRAEVAEVREAVRVVRVSERGVVILVCGGDGWGGLVLQCEYFLEPQTWRVTRLQGLRLGDKMDGRVLGGDCGDGG